MTEAKLDHCFWPGLSDGCNFNLILITAEENWIIYFVPEWSKKLIKNTSRCSRIRRNWLIPKTFDGSEYVTQRSSSPIKFGQYRSKAHTKMVVNYYFTYFVFLNKYILPELLLPYVASMTSSFAVFRSSEKVPVMYMAKPRKFPAVQVESPYLPPCSAKYIEAEENSSLLRFQILELYHFQR